MQDGFLMGSERIPCGLPTVTSPPKGQASGYEKKYFLTLDSLWLATGNINSARKGLFVMSHPNPDLGILKPLPLHYFPLFGKEGLGEILEFSAAEQLFRAIVRQCDSFL